MPSGDTDTIYPHALLVNVSISGCPQSVLRHVNHSNSTDSSNDLTVEYDGRYGSSVGCPAGDPFSIPLQNDPDSMRVPLPGLFEMDAFHYSDNVAFNQPHVSANYLYGTSGPYYFPIGGSTNIAAGGPQLYHLTVH